MFGRRELLGAAAASMALAGTLQGEIAPRGFTEVKNAKPALPGFGLRHFVRTA